jgi:hypothetical protein
LGYALALGKVIVTVGHRESVFYCLPQVVFMPTWEEARADLLISASVSPTMARRVLELGRQIATKNAIIDDLQVALALPAVVTPAEDPEPEPLTDAEADALATMLDPDELLPAPVKVKKRLGAGVVSNGRPLPAPPAELAEKSGSWTGDRVRRLQVLLDLDNETLARMLGISSSHVSNWRRGAYAPPQKHWAALDEIELQTKGVTV